MSNLLRGQWKQYFQMPCLPENEQTLSCAAFRYYGFLCREMNARSATELHYSNAEITLATSIRCHKTLKKARSELVSARLVDCRQVPPGVYAHIMLNHCGDPIPAPEDRKGIRRYSPRDSTKARASRTKAVPLVPDPAPAFLPPTKAMYCFTHRRDTKHWERQGEYLCEECHPDPNSFHPPTADEIGF
jgi:hypothetical protein